jgi:membrane protease YdiL (CAAX protease family)
MKKENLKDILVFIISFVLYYIFGTGLIYLALKAVYDSNSSLFPAYIQDISFRERGLSNLAQLISSIIILLVIVIMYFKSLKGHFSFLKNYKLIFKTIGYALLVYFVTICYNLFLPFFGGSGEDGSNVALIKASMKNQYWIMFVLVVVLGPIIEELLFRFIPFKALKDKISMNKLLLISTVLFTIPHLFSLVNSSDVWGDILALPKFLIIGWMLGSYYYKNNDIGRVILVHMLYNIVSFVLMSVSLSLI